MKIKKELTKREIQEIINNYGDLIGDDDITHVDSDLESQANRTSDYNVTVGGQPFRYDLLGRFGFTLLPFFEGKENDEQLSLIEDLSKKLFEIIFGKLKEYHKNPNKLKADFKLFSEKDFDELDDDKKQFFSDLAKTIIKLVQLHFEKNLSKIDKSDIVVEDIIFSEKNENELSKKSEINDIKEKSLQKIADLLIRKLDDENLDKLINILLEKR